MDYLKFTIITLSNLIYNSQWESTKKEDLVKHLKNIVDEYNKRTGENIKYD